MNCDFFVFQLCDHSITFRLSSENPEWSWFSRFRYEVELIYYNFHRRFYKNRVFYYLVKPLYNVPVFIRGSYKIVIFWVSMGAFCGSSNIFNKSDFSCFTVEQILDISMFIWDCKEPRCYLFLREAFLDTSLFNRYFY